MPKKKKPEIITCDLTTAARLIDVDRDSMIERLHEKFVLLKNGDGQNIANTTMCNLGLFQNELINHNGVTACPTFELVKVTHWGMNFLRIFCRDEGVKRQYKHRKQASIELAKSNCAARKACIGLAETLEGTEV